MKFLLAILGCMLAAASVAVGQAVSVELALDQEQYLLGEPLPLKVRVTNFTGQNLRLGMDENLADFRGRRRQPFCRDPAGRSASSRRVHPRALHDGDKESKPDALL